MSRTRVAERMGFSDPVRFLCSCGKRIAVGGGDGSGGFDFVPLGTWKKGQPVRADDWYRLDCPNPRCGRTWEGRRGQLAEAWRGAVIRGATSTTLPRP